MITKEFERAINIYPFAPIRLESDTDEDFERKVLTTGTISILKIGANIGKISCDFTLPDRAQTPEQFVKFKRKLTSAFDAALVISANLLRN